MLKLPEKIASKSLLEAVEQIHEKTLSAGQKKIAKMAGDPEKIDAKDFEALRMKKEEVEQVDEITYSAKEARAGKDIGKPGKHFADIASKAAAKYGSKEAGKRVAGAILAKLRSKHG